MNSPAISDRAKLCAARVGEVMLDAVASKVATDEAMFILRNEMAALIQIAIDEAVSESKIGAQS